MTSTAFQHGLLDFQHGAGFQGFISSLMLYTYSWPASRKASSMAVDWRSPLSSWRQRMIACLVDRFASPPAMFHSGAADFGTAFHSEKRSGGELI